MPPQRWSSCRTKDFHGAFETAGWRTSWVVLATLALTAVLGAALARALSAPLQRLATRVDATARRYAGQPPRKVPRGEVVRLAHSVETMTGVLVNYSGRLEQAHRKATEDVAELARSEADLRVMAAVAASTTSLVAVTDPEGLVTWVNDGFWRSTGYELDEVRGRAIADFIAGRRWR